MREKPMAARSTDFSNYKTVTSPELFQIQWEPFYRQGLERANALKQDYTSYSDISYGENFCQTLDIYLPKVLSATTPTLVFLHGGAFREGHPAQYGFLGEHFLSRNYAFISAGYRLAPDAYYPDHVDDMIVLSRWLHQNLSTYGLNSRHMVVSGHSAGSLMLAVATVRDDWQKVNGVPEDILDFVVLAGANYDHSYEFADNLIKDVSRRKEGTAIHNLKRVPKRAVIIFGVNELNTGDPTRFERGSRPLAKALTDRGCQVDLFALPDANHQDTCRAIGDTNGPAFSSVVAALEAARSH